MLARKAEAAPVKTAAKISSSALRIGEPDNAFERQADRAADAVMAGHKAPQWSLSRMNIDAPLQRQSPGGQIGAAPPIVHEVLRTPGQRLDDGSRAFFEQRFQHDFSKVRIHAGDKASASAKSVQARAYTVGHHIVFGSHGHAQDSNAARHLLAHELAHVVQQGDARSGSLLQRQTDDKSDAGRTAPAGPATSTPAGSATPIPAGPATPTPAGPATHTFALTFDDGPHAAPLGKGTNRTEKVLDALQSKQVKAGFFIQTAALDPQGHAMRGSTPVGRALVARMHSDGHVVGVHTGGKKDHELHTTAQKAGRLESELRSAESYIKTETGVDPTYVRPPTGKSNADVLKTYATVGLTNLLWDIDGDGGSSLPLATLKKNLTRGISEVHGRSPPWKGDTPAAPKIVVLLHDIQAGTANNVGVLIDHIRAETTRISGGTDVADFGPP
jgi:peptidoglycan/xylan/chitin deacetylase (PgdA/CDA1 family)